MSHAEALWIATIAGVVQGITEFLPISSDGHLALVRWLAPSFDLSLEHVVLLHGATLMATVWVLRRDLATQATEILSLFGHPCSRWRANESARQWYRVLIASVPTAIIGLSLKDRVDDWATTPWVVGAGFLGSAAALYSTKAKRAVQPSKQASPGDFPPPGAVGALLLGVVQGLAVLPGVSRSGFTIACALWLGMSAPQAFRFSFMLSLPAIGGAFLLEALTGTMLVGLGQAEFIAFAVALGVGVVALSLLRHLVTRGKLWIFALYLVPLGLLCFTV